ncbi:MAG: NADH-quinone oxidoreductase subunit M [Verrucomicrobiae bacterium]|nr:NADH-quinone oxidoreductase subunit M [Verrucomicrobiae bacterium]
MHTDWTIYLTLLGVGVIMLLPASSKALIRCVALLTGLAGLAVGLADYVHYNRIVGELIAATGSGFVHVRDVPWIPALNSRYHLAVDGINLPLVLLNGFVCVTGILFSWNIEERAKEFFAFFLVLIAGVYGVFLAMDLFLLFVFYELAIIPKYFIIAIWGSTRKEYGAMKLVLYSFVGSALVFIGLLAIYVAAGSQTFDILELAKTPVGRELQFWIFPLLFVGFAVLAGMWPFHTWAPTGHVAAPTAASMLLAGVVMKLGSYGCFRAGMLLMPEGLELWKWPLAWLAVVGIVYGAAVAMVQQDFKFIIGYSSVSHMGFVLLGLMTLDVYGLSGAVLQMFSHGIVASLLFAVVGRMVYDRTHTRMLDELGGLRKTIPFAALTFVVAGAASMGMPGFSGFVAEIQVLIGAFRMSPWLAVGAALSIPITVAYILNANNKVFMERDKPHGGHGHESGNGEHEGHSLPPITWPEKIAAVILMALLVIVGLYPSCLMDIIKPNVELFLRGLS